MVCFKHTIDFHRIPALRHLDADITTAMAEAARAHYLKPTEVLLYQGDIIHSFYAIQCGGIRLVDYAEDGQSVALKMYGQGDIFGLLAVSGGYPHSTQIEAVHESLVIAIDGADVRSLMIAYPVLGLTIVDLLTAHVHEAHTRIRAMAITRVDRRLARSLLHLCAKFGQEDGHNIVLDVPLSQRDLAEFSGTTVETVNRTLKQWQKQHLVSCGHKRVIIHNQAVLEDIAENRLLNQSNSTKN